MKLISSQSFGKTLADKSDAEYRRLRDNYDAFIELPPHPPQFVAMDDDGNILEEPKDDSYLGGRGGVDAIKLLQYEKLKDQWKQAQLKVLFEGFEIIKDNYHQTIREIIYLPNTQKQVWRRLTYHNGKVETFFFTYYDEFKTISDLIPYNLTLTANAKK